jgi:UDP-glucose 4-epimerase
LLESVERLVGVHVERVHTDSRTGDVKHSQAENEVLRSLFPAIAPTPLDTGLRSTIDWMRTQI